MKIKANFFLKKKKLLRNYWLGAFKTPQSHFKDKVISSVSGEDSCLKRPLKTN